MNTIRFARFNARVYVYIVSKHYLEGDSQIEGVFATSAGAIQLRDKIKGDVSRIDWIEINIHEVKS